MDGTSTPEALAQQPQPVPRKQIAKRATEDRIAAELRKYPGHRLIRVNWKKLTVHIVNGFGNRKVIHLGGVE